MARGSFTRKSDFAFKHVNQSDEPVYGTTAELKTDLDSQAKELRDFANDNLLAELEANTAKATSGAKKVGLSSTFGDNVQEAFDAVESLGTGTLPPDASITDAKLVSDVKVGSLASLATTVKTSVVNAINEVVTSIGSLASLTTTVKTSVVNAINEVVTSIGSLASLTTTVKTSVVNAINEVVTAFDDDIGKIEYFAMVTPPTRRLEAKGQAVSRTTYAKLFAKIGTLYGVGDGSTTFNLPDMRGVFPRGWDNSKGYDTGRVFGSYQADDNKSHTHTNSVSSDGVHTHNIVASANVGASDQAYPVKDSNTGNRTITTDSAGSHNHTVTIDSTGSTEVKVKNIALLACIKY